MLARAEVTTVTATEELSVVMPVYNEESIVAATVEEWCSAMRESGVQFAMIVVEDGSTDRTPDLLQELGGRFRELVVHSQPNMGHGPAVLRGYGESRGEWVLQIDSDGEVSPSDFPAFWSARDRYDFILGRRVNRDLSVARNWLSRMASFSSRISFGSRFRDVNCPFRLMRKTILDRNLPLIPSTVFAPNVILSGLAARDGWRTLELPVRWVPRRTGVGQQISPRLVFGALQSALLMARLSRTRP